MEVATENNPNLHFSHNISKYYYGCIMSGVYLLTWILDLSDKAVVSKLYIYIFKYTHTHRVCRSKKTTQSLHVFCCNNIAQCNFIVL